MNFFDILKDYKPYRGIADNLRNTPISVAGIVESAQGHLISCLSKDNKGKGLVITYSDMEAEELKKDLELYTDEAIHFPNRDYILYNIETSDHERQNERLAAISKLNELENPIMVASLDAVLGYTISPQKFMEYLTTLQKGKRYDIGELSKKLMIMGYVREDMVEGKGQFSIRGEIMDIFSPAYDNPVRIDFFDDEIETIKFFDLLSQRSVEDTDNVWIIPACEALMEHDTMDRIVRELTQLKKNKSAELIKNLETDIDNFNERYYFPSIDKYAYEIYNEIPSILDYFNDTDLVFVVDPRRIKERGKSYEYEKNEIISELKVKDIVPSKKKPFYINYSDAISKILTKREISLDSLNHTRADFNYKHLETFVTKTTVSFHGKLEYLYDDLTKYQKEKQTVVILASNRGRGENLKGVLLDKGYDTEFYYNGNEFRNGKISILRGNHAKGFEYPELGFVLICDDEIFTSKRKHRKRKIENANKLKSYNDVTAGDYVVHEVHGIGQYMGTQKMTVGNITKEYLKIQYRGSDVLYVPIDQLDVLYKYVGGDTQRQLKLNKLGSQDWNKTKQKVKESTAKLAKELIALYASRLEIKGHAYAPDTHWQRDFEDRFEYAETDDQLRAIEEVKADMEKQKPMDRLLCGDVGFGKTEVALRAAFKAVNDSKQVAYFCPTTILAMQHYETFLKRMEGFPVKVEMLSRFRSAAATKKILKQLKSGEIDVVIGTHKLLGKNVHFKDLGLLIIDEEQRFGVAHKERLKELKNTVDVLTMTATPIPRTLHMAMTSVRDMSVLTEPPQNRYPVQTYVLEENEGVILDAIRNELSRGGQVFYLYNHVDGIHRKANIIKEHFPDKNIAVGHGKMKEDELEDIMCDMVDGNIDVLVCTTIIETGLDIPNANTIIIEDADRMGLAQLYQLRGRVGRSNRAAYAYITYKRDKALSDVASKRLRAIKEFTEFGSGFKIAMRDLEIRGAGNILGPEQHGHMDTVGYDMYCKILRESINEAQNIVSVEDMTISIDIEVNAYIPDSYIQNHNQRIDMYKRISAISCDEDRFEIEDELCDRYGDMPKTVKNIIEIASMKPVARELGIYEIIQKGRLLTLKFLDQMLDATLIWDIDGKFPKRIKVLNSNTPAISIKLTDEDIDTLGAIKNILNTIEELKNPNK